MVELLSGTVQVYTDKSGAVHVSNWNRWVAARAPAAAPVQLDTAVSPSDCNDKYDPAPYGGLPHWTEGSAVQWWFNSGSTPSGLDVTAIEGAIRNGGNNVQNMNTNCSNWQYANGCTDCYDPVLSYQGRNSRSVNMYQDANGNTQCGSGDTYSEVGFGTLGGNLVGLTCVWWHCGTGCFMDEGDIRLDKSAPWTSRAGSGCTSNYDVENVMTHERMHFVGVAEDLYPPSLHANLTMWGSVAPCETKKETLGWGDLDTVLLLGVALSVTAALAAGCGGSNGTPGSSRPATTVRAKDGKTTYRPGRLQTGDTVTCVGGAASQTVPKPGTGVGASGFIQVTQNNDGTVVVTCHPPPSGATGAG